MSRLRRAYVDTGEGQLHYRVAGAGGEPIVLLQILPLSTLLLEGLAEALADQGYAIHLFDLMGYGGSSPRKRVWGVEDFAVNLNEAIEALGLGCVSIVSGHFTAMVAVELALRQPQAVRALVLDGVTLWSRDVAAERLGDIKPPEPLLADGEALHKRWTALIGLLRKFNPDIAVTGESQAAVFHAFSHFVDIGLGPDTTGSILRYDMAAALAQVTCPVMIVGSPTDTLRPFHENAVALIPGARAHLFEIVHPLYDLAPTSAKAAPYVDVILPFLRGDTPS